MRFAAVSGRGDHRRSERGSETDSRGAAGAAASSIRAGSAWGFNITAATLTTGSIASAAIAAVFAKPARNENHMTFPVLILRKTYTRSV